ncbi:hypothetical protein L7F22_065322 [Adiantum nelumboides]|nr:hypothetical protein [Adiantum nelumboides]
MLGSAGDGEHRLNPDSIAEIDKALDEVENDTSISALVTTNEGNFFSNGLDFEFLRANPDKHTHLIVVFQKLLHRFLCFPIPTVAAICGDFKRRECTVHCLNLRKHEALQVEIKLPLTPGMNAIIKSKLPVPTYHEAVLTAHRYVGKTAATAGIIHGACSDVNSTRETAVKKASELASRNYDRLVYKALKEEMFKWEAGELLHGSLKGVPESLARASKL